MRGHEKWLLAAAILPLLVWSALALAFSPAFPGWFGLPGSLVWAGFALTVNCRSRCAPRWLGVTAVGIVLVAIVHFAQSPGGSRAWVEEHERGVSVSWSDGAVSIENLRNTIYGHDGTLEGRTWYSDVFLIDELDRIDFVHEIFSSTGLLAHGFLSFEFSDGRHLAVSVEARRSRGESYGPVRGLFRNYGLIYILGRETDLIGTRANIRKNPVYIYPIRATREEAQGLFRSILERAERLEGQPEFYHTITNNCVTSILLHVNEVAEKPLRYDLRILFPGLADGLIHERGLLDFDGSREAARKKFLINDRSAPVSDPSEWSRQIREVR